MIRRGKGLPALAVLALFGVLTTTCLNGVEYQFTLTVLVGLGVGRTEERPFSVQEVCDHGRY